nr:3-keto-5-aminohexanoate cleavage protein [Deinococcus fonticola]
MHGMDDVTWPLLRRAARITGASRIGFEDVLTLPDGQPAHSNAQLYQADWRLMQEVPL